jgi:DNA-binding transcriptional regulator YiaG
MDVELDIDAALKSFEDTVKQLKGKKKMVLRCKKVDVAVEPRVWSRVIADIRKRLKYSQEEFAGLLNVKRDTVASWETGRKKPSGPSLRLLQVVDKHPKIVVKCAASVVATEEPVGSL